MTMKRLKATLLFIFSVIILALIIICFSYKIPNNFDSKLCLYDPATDEKMTTNFKIKENYFFFKENLTYVYWENDLGIFSCYVYDDDPIYKKINTKFFSNARTYPLWDSNSKQSDKVKDIIFVQQYKKEFQITYTGKGSDGQWEYKQFWGPANTRDEALKVKKNLEDHGAKSNPYLQ